MSNGKPDTGPPFGTIYFGGVLAALGVLITVTSTYAIGPVLAIAGVLFVCTGLILRGLYRVTASTSAAGQERTRAAQRP